LSLRDLFRRGVFMHVYLQAKLQAGYARSDRNMKDEIRSSGFTKDLIKSNVRGLRRTTSGLEWKRTKSAWSDYTNSTSYSEQDDIRKAEFVSSVVQEKRRDLVWDLGCNTGRCSLLASKQASYVVATDSDHLAVEI